MGRLRSTSCLVLALLLRVFLAHAAGPGQTPAAVPGLDTETSRKMADVERLLVDFKSREAEQAARDLLAKTEAAAGSASAPTAEVMDLLVRCLVQSKPKDPGTRRVADQCIEVKRKLYGPNDARFATSLANKALCLDVSGDLQPARVLFEQALGIIERNLGPNAPQLAATLKDYCDVLGELGDYPSAIRGFERALAILRAVPSPDELQLASVLNGHAIVMYQTGEYVRARSSWDRAIEIRERRYGPDHPRVTALQNNLAALLTDEGDFQAAKELENHVLDCHLRTLTDPKHFLIGIDKLALAVLARNTGNLQDARALYESALEILRAHFGEEHELTAKCLHGLGMVNHELGRFDQARSYYEKALAIRERIHPPDHITLGGTLRWWAALDYEFGRLHEARQLCERAERIYTKALGAEHPEMGQLLALRARILAASGDSAGALASALHAEAIGAAQLQLVSRGVSEREALVYAGVRPRGLSLALQMLADGSEPSTVPSVWDAVVRSRALVFEAMASRSRSAAMATDVQARQALDRFRIASSRVSHLVVRGPGDDPKRFSRILEDASREKEAAERDLAARSSVFRQDLARARQGLVDVAAKLPKGSALVAYAEYERSSTPGSPNPMVANSKGAAPDPEPALHVLAFVLQSGGVARVVPIGSTKQVESLVTAWIDEVSRRPRGNAREVAAAESDYIASGEALRKCVWDPIQPHLGTARRVFVVPEGALYKVSFATLPDPAGGYCVETGWRFHYLNAERDLVPTADRAVKGTRLVAVGGVDFDVASGEPVAELAAVGGAVTSGEPEAAGSEGTRGARLPYAGLVYAHFDSLPGTFGEVERAAEWVRSKSSLSHKPAGDLTSVTLLTGKEATEKKIKMAITGCGALHFATHGFFLTPPSGTPSSATRASQFALQNLRPEPCQPQVNPLQLSGLALASANNWSKAPVGAEDGLLLANEVAASDLHSVRWAVLSACKTGVGEVQAGEGIFGLRRAFQVAGVRSLVMSLWDVSDQATSTWMDAFYATLMGRNVGVAEAVAEATLRTLAERRRRGDSTHPYYWGAFVATGDWK